MEYERLTKIFSARAVRAPGKWAAGALMALALVLPSNPHRPPPPEATTHSRISVMRNTDGSVKLGLYNSPISYNWSGYSLLNFSTGQLYTATSGGWTVPEVSFVRTATTCQPVTSWGFSKRTTCFSPNVHYEYSSTWVGIGGWCMDARCSQVDQTVIQLGTEQTAGDDGTNYYYAWYELFPANSIRLDSTLYPVAPGDSMSASLDCTASCTPGDPNQTWHLSMTNATQSWTFTIDVPYVSSLLSADWIVEAPSSNAGILPLANFGTATMDAFGALPNSGFGGPGVYSVTMVNEYGQTSVPSAATSAGQFSACWGSNMVRYAPCAAPVSRQTD